MVQVIKKNEKYSFTQDYSGKGCRSQSRFPWQEPSLR